MRLDVWCFHRRKWTLHVEAGLVDYWVADARSNPCRMASCPLWKRS